ncbi:caspase family protein [Flammeovirga pacifica]|uniref:Peptidase C14 caspase domain-containing protein n=1 Tax=Flammeovirga pacifica TaxID=915059 RepID=A0A1S1YT40_FLAPC|nr:caspase family protein [Flammeovirga pacifica]OHX64201.1 hypothetical protein NH26_21595 [Flammeovirga pacifica]
MKKLSYIFLIFILLCQSAQAQTVEEIWGKHMKNAREWFELDDFPNAVNDYLKAKETLPTDSVAYLEGAMSAAYALDDTNFNKFKSEFTSVFKYTSPSFHEYAEIMLQSRIQKGEENPETLYQLGIDKYPNNAEMYAAPLLGMYFEQNKIEEAKNLLINVVPLVKNAEFPYTLGVMYQQEGDIDNALIMYDKALSLNPKHLDSNYNIGTIYYNKAVNNINKLNNLSLENFESEATELNKLSLAHLQKAKPYIEKAAADTDNPTDAFEFLQTTLVLMDHVHYINETIEESAAKDNSIIAFSDETNTDSKPEDATIAINTVTPSVNENANLSETEKEKPNPLLPPKLLISDIHFEYADGATALAKGSSGKLKLRVENWGDGTSYAPTIRLNSLMHVTGLNFNREVKLQNIAPDASVDVEIDINYVNAASRGFKAIKSPQNKFILMIKDSLNYKTEQQEFVLNLNQSENKTVQKAAPVVAKKDTNTSTNFLILIAANEYTSWSPLVNAVNDANNFKDVLLDKYQYEAENVYELYNEKVTKSEIDKLIRSLSSKIGPEDKLVIYYSGHGYYDTFMKKGFWVPVNAKLSGDDTSDYLSNQTILDYIKVLNTKHTLLISDACYSGSIFSSESRGMKYADPIETLPSRWGLASGGLTEVSDGEEGGHSPFNMCLTTYLRSNTTAKLPISDVARSVRYSVSFNSTQEPQGKPLRDVGHMGGEFVFKLRNYQ